MGKLSLLGNIFSIQSSGISGRFGEKCFDEKLSFFEDDVRIF